MLKGKKIDFLQLSNGEKQWGRNNKVYRLCAATLLFDKETTFRN